MLVTVLHISDLHRDEGSAITTDTLLESLRRDSERYTIEDGLRAPDLAIVSGDIVYGVGTDGPDADAALKQQYDEAATFLTALADIFFGGNRERIVLVPGNHDVSHPHVLRATAIAPLPKEPQQRAVVARQLSEDSSPWRWVSADFALRRIVDVETYHRRLAPYAEFYSAFYSGKRTFPLDPAMQYSIHDFPEVGLVVAGLCSCCDNDLFSRSGRIHPDCVAGATRDIAAYLKRGRMPLAVWHHSLAGGPKESDYVDADVLQSLMDGGFAMGLHGHQHRPQFLEHRFTADRKRAIAVISAGTLCGGPRALPPGRMRAYNLVVLDTEKGLGVLHVRDMKNTGFSMPVWGPAHVTEFGGSSIDFELKMPARSVSVVQIAADAATLLRTGDAAAAYALVRRHRSDGLARRVALEALVQMKDWSEIRDVCTPPSSPSEFIALSEALYELGRKPELAALVESDFAKNNSDPGIRQSVELARNRLGGVR